MKLSKKFVILTAGCAAFVISVLAYHWLFHSVDFNDNPAILKGISSGGVVSVESYYGEVTGVLCGVRWQTNDQFLQEATKLIQAAQADTVAFEKTQDGCLRVWFIGENGARSLNDEISRINTLAENASF